MYYRLFLQDESALRCVSYHSQSGHEVYRRMVKAKLKQDSRRFSLNAKLAKEINEKWKDALLTSCPQWQENNHNGVHCGAVTATLGLKVKNGNRSTIYMLAHTGEHAPVVITLHNKLDVFSWGSIPCATHGSVWVCFETVQLYTESSSA